MTGAEWHDAQPSESSEDEMWGDVGSTLAARR
jgi:hypothetical protein